MYMYREVATLRMLMSWTSTPDIGLWHIIRYANRAQNGGVRHPPSVQIHQSIRFPAGFCNIFTWKASSGRNLKANFTKTRRCCKTAGAFCH